MVPSCLQIVCESNYCYKSAEIIQVWSLLCQLAIILKEKNIYIYGTGFCGRHCTFTLVSISFGTAWDLNQVKNHFIMAQQGHKIISLMPSWFEKCDDWKVGRFCMSAALEIKASHFLITFILRFIVRSQVVLKFKIILYFKNNLIFIVSSAVLPVLPSISLTW